MTVAGKNRISDIYRSKYRRGVIRERNTPPSRISKNISAVKSKDGARMKEKEGGGGSKIDEAHSSRRRPTFRIEESFLCACERCCGKNGWPPKQGRGERTPRRLTKERSGEKARDSVGKSGRLPDEDKHNSELSREAVGPLPLLTYFIRGKRGFVGARRGWRRWPWRIHARPCVISWLSSVERATQRVAHAREVRKSCGVNTRWWDTRVFHPSRSGFLQSRYLWSGPCFRPRAFSRPSRKPRDSFIIRSDFERTFRRRA